VGSQGPPFINEAKIGFNGTKTRISGFAPAIPGVDTSAFAVSFTGTVAIPEIGGQARPPAQLARQFDSFNSTQTAVDSPTRITR